jgi:hypothetical protein
MNMLSGLNPWSHKACPSSKPHVKGESERWPEPKSGRASAREQGSIFGLLIFCYFFIKKKVRKNRPAEKAR